MFWKAPDFSAGAVKPVNMIDEERDTCPALLALYHPFVRYTHFTVFQSEKYTYRFLGFGVVLTALSRLRGCALNSRFLGVRSGLNLILPLLHPRFNTFSRGFLAASRRNIQGSDFSLFTLCSIAFLTGTNGMFSPLYFCWSYLFKRAGAGHIAVDFSMAIRSVRTWQNPTFKRAENLIKLNIQIGANLSKPDF